MKFAVVTLGSAGDLHPFLAIARALAERGHEVHVLSQAPHAQAVHDEGLRFAAVASKEDHDRTLGHPFLWHPLHGFGVLWRHLAVPAIGPTIEMLDALSGDGPLTVFASPLAVGARLARERWPERIRLMSGYTAPMGLRSTAEPMFLGAWRVPPWLPDAARRCLWWALDRWKLEPMARPAVQRWTQRLGLPGLAGSLFGDVLHSPDGGIAMFPDWFAPLDPRWAVRGVRQTGFPIFEPARAAPLPESAATLVAGKEPYAVVYPGSAAKRADVFAQPVIRACRALNLRVLLLSRFFEDGNATHPGVLRVDTAPLHRVLPAASVFIHHGGIGSMAQGFAAQAPQLVLASAYDQFENGARLQQLDRGRWLRLENASSSSVKRSLERLLVDTPHLRRTPNPSLVMSEALHPNAAAAETCGLLELSGLA